VELAIDKDGMTYLDIMTVAAEIITTGFDFAIDRVATEILCHDDVQAKIDKREHHD
jgi:hypothetical protein